MILESRGSRRRQPVGIPLPVDALVMVPDNRSDLRISIDVRQDALADLRVALHFTPLVKREGSGLLEKPSWETDLPDVVDQSAQVGQFDLVGAKLHALGDIARIDATAAEWPAVY